MRYSHQRNIIYQSICAVKTHPNAHEVIKMVQPYIPKISSGTVYRNLSQLVKNKMINDVPSKKIGNVKNIFNAIITLIKSDYISAAEIKIDGGI